MNLPIYPNDGFGYETGMALGAALGFAFGFILERAGFGSARVLVAQFYGRDMRVFKVMFSGIVTTAVGLGILGGLGMVDLAMLKVPETFLGPQLVGGLLLGVGFILSGYCPGTAVVAAGSGHLDGLVVTVGIMVGSLVFGAVFPAIEGFYGSGAQGVHQLHTALGLPWAVVAVGVTLMALGCFVGAEWVERWVARRSASTPPPSDERVRRVSFGGLALASLVGVAALAVPSSGEAVVTPTTSAIDPVTLATRLVADPQGLHVVDLRAADRCQEARVPGAHCLPAEDTEGALLADLPATRPLVVYGQDGPPPLPAGAARFEGTIYVLEGGYSRFAAELLTPPVPPQDATPAQVEAYSLRAALHGHLTGSATTQAPVQAAPRAAGRAIKKGGGC